MTEREANCLFAILRHDGFHSAETPVENRVTVTKIVRGLERAKTECQRLNALKPDGRSYYWWQYTRLEEQP